jgi:hypothetical protein
MNGNMPEDQKPGATYMTLNDSIKVQEQLNCDVQPASGIIGGKDGKPCSMLYTPYSPKTWIYIYPKNKEGALFPTMLSIPGAFNEASDIRVLCSIEKLCFAEVGGGGAPPGVPPPSMVPCVPVFLCSFPFYAY